LTILDTKSGFSVISTRFSFDCARKKEETRLKHEEKMNRIPQDKSALLPDIARNYEKRRSEVINRINCMEEEKKNKLEKKRKRVENANKRHKENIQIVREKSMMNGFDQSLEECNDLDGDQGYNGSTYTFFTHMF
jgi:hypothetical protein